MSSIAADGMPPRFAAANLHRLPNNPRYDELIDTLIDQDHVRSAFLKACLRKLGLEVPDDDVDIPSLSNIHLSSMNHVEAEDLVNSFEDILTIEDGEEYIRAESSTFRLERSPNWSMKGLSASLPGDDDAAKGKLSADGEFIDYSGVIQDLVPHDRAWPKDKDTPDFQHSFYYNCLQAYQQIETEARSWGNTLAYAEVVTSTNTTMDK